MAARGGAAAALTRVLARDGDDPIPGRDKRLSAGGDGSQLAEGISDELREASLVGLVDPALDGDPEHRDPRLAKTRTALGKEANAVRKGESPTRRELEAEARRLDIKGRSKMGKYELKRAVARAK